MIRMFLLKTPSQQFSSSRQTTSHHVLAAVGKSRKRAADERVESTGSAMGSYPEHPSCFVLIVLRSALPVVFA
ncbi:hypothetical protein [Reticulibacter mediterranei]|uniref:hypothetical protein n=1 Tax=Reticulibacter mediterranei TaxID=2778369 RepID=UPI001C687D70|nr:hypothetical protein [Reticulibacter mediterranei]